MKRGKHPSIILKNTSKDSLLLASRFAIPFGYGLVGSLIAFNLVALIHPGIEQPPFPVMAVILSSLPVALLGLVFSHRAVRRELRNRREEPSHLRKALLRVSLFAGVGLVLWLALFFVTLFALERLTSISNERALEISAVLPIIPIALCGCLLARKEVASCCRSGRSTRSGDS
jgi:hypothetical protein